MSVALNPKPMLPVAADAGTASSNRAAASTAGTRAMTFVFMFQAFLPVTGNRWRTQPETQRLLRPPGQLLNKSTNVSPDGQEHADRMRSERRLGRRPDRPFPCEHTEGRSAPRPLTKPT